MKITIEKALDLKQKPTDESTLGFGQLFTDHMFNMDYSPEKGWHNPRIEPYKAFEMDPASMVLHYGQGVFEGMKAYKTKFGDINLFRPRENFKRLNSSNERLCIPELDEAFVLAALKQLLEIEKDWIPKTPGTSLYIRPTVIATDPFLGVRASSTYRFFIILSPVGAYYAEGFNPIKIWVSEEYVRAIRGGVGNAKTLGNYAASLYAANVAQQQGYSQVLWLDGVERKYIEEVGAMNIFFIIEDELITPELSGSILPGITRDSVLAMADHWGMKVTERKITILEVMDKRESGTLTEIFGSGTAAVISPVSELKYGKNVMTIGEGKVGPVASKLFESLQDIQYGNAADPFGWVERI